MTYEQALAMFGTQANLARVLGVTQSTVSLWGKGPRGAKVFTIPESYQFKLEVITDGRLRADEAIRRPFAAQQAASGTRKGQAR